MAVTLIVLVLAWPASGRLTQASIDSSARAEEQRRAAAHEEVRAHVNEQQAFADNDAAGADAAGQRLRDEAGLACEASYDRLAE
ncbi:DUF2514 family protein [Pseudomonas sp. RIT623]|uniref:DUF2514 family protein n=1 Tax=Pseudomonas sp. RIT623 TaxID=2559075 RepID=UPI00106F2471|nr:DUF2514 family protein [Pseudomonas sp. RIT623]TFF42596.1 DUF2514 family protein [Pseudomonas sp. RIT623]